LIECDTAAIADGDTIEIDLDSGGIVHMETGTRIVVAPIPRTMQVLLKDGGLIPHLKKHGGFALE
jgi:3-isopropylmalate/(R)-2-methylmalate dehydratase small subunit